MINKDKLNEKIKRLKDISHEKQKDLQWGTPDVNRERLKFQINSLEEQIDTLEIIYSCIN